MNTLSRNKTTYRINIAIFVAMLGIIYLLFLHNREREEFEYNLYENLKDIQDSLIRVQQKNTDSLISLYDSIVIPDHNQVQSTITLKYNDLVEQINSNTPTADVEYLNQWAVMDGE